MPPKVTTEYLVVYSTGIFKEKLIWKYEYIREDTGSFKKYPDKNLHGDKGKDYDVFNKR